MELRITAKQKKHAIDYTHANIIQYPDAIIALQNAIIHKIFSNSNADLQKSIVHKMYSSLKIFEIFVKKMEDLKKYSPERLYQRSKSNDEHYNQDEDEKVLHRIIRKCLLHMSE